MLPLATDADVRGEIIRGLRKRFDELDLIRSQDVLPIGAPDEDVLHWAIAEQRVLITNDRKTMLDHISKASARGEPFAGAIVTSSWQSIGRAIEDIAVVAFCVPAEEIRDRVIIYLPL